jgi:threonine aldolase
MVEAMRVASGQRGGFGPREDLQVRALEELAAAMVGKEDALFCPTCGMANQLAIHLACRPGDALVAEAQAHVIVSEAGGPAALSGVMCRGVPGVNGVPDAALLGEALAGGDSQRSRAALLVVENTHVRLGGAVIDLAASRALQAAARQQGVPVHLDGSRLFNAAASLQLEASELAATADTVAFSLNKGLAAPLGAILAGPRNLISEAVRVRQMFGGGWRPAGIMAAAARVALQTMPGRLAQDHHVAQELARALARVPGVSAGQPQVPTNLVLLDLAPALGTSKSFAERVARHGVRVLPFGLQRVRLATYHEIGLGHIAPIEHAFRVAAGECGLA